MKLDGRMLVLAAVAACAALSLPAVATAGDDEEVRKAGTCTASSRMSIRLRADEDDIRIDLEIRTQQRGSAWSVILLRERRTVFRGVVRSPRSSRTVKLRRTIDDWVGRDSIVVRASGPRLETCRVSATI
jgi:2-methylaconitate cis-trans-isomerase PrpF